MSSYISLARRSHCMEDVDTRAEPMHVSIKPDLIKSRSFSDLDHIKKEEENEKKMTE